MVKITAIQVIFLRYLPFVPRLAAAKAPETHSMAEEKKKKILKKLKNKYRLVIMNDDTFEEKASWRLTPLNVFVSAGVFLISFTFLLTYVIAFTPLREYIPGYADVNMQRHLRTISEQVEDIQSEIGANEKYLENLRNIVNGDLKKETQEMKKAPQPATRYDSIKIQKTLPRSEEDSLLRDMVESSE
jgi:ABC-type transporter MlaC component